MNPQDRALPLVDTRIPLRYMYALVAVLMAVMFHHLFESVEELNLTPVSCHPSPNLIVGFAFVNPKYDTVLNPKNPSKYV